MADAVRPELRVRPVEWPEIAAGDDLVRLLADTGHLADGDIAVVTSKVVSKAEGRVTKRSRREAVAAETVRTLATRGDSVVAETRHGLVMAAAGVDASNTAAGTVVLLPVDPDESARLLRQGVAELIGVNVAVLVSDTMGRAWRNGQTDLAIGCAGMSPSQDLRGTRDAQGNALTVTVPAIADELASAADLVKGKASRCPVAVVSGLGHLVLAPGEHGGGAAALIRDSSLDLFGLGTREAAVAAALRDDPVALSHFPPIDAQHHPFAALVSDRESVEVVVGPAEEGVASPGPDATTYRRSWLVAVRVRDGAPATDQRHAGALAERARVLAAAHRLQIRDDSAASHAGHGWQTVDGFLATAP